MFLADRYAYKLKKPIRLAFLDFSTLALRRHFCEEEIRLNRRLAPEVYLGTVPLTRKKDAALALGGNGTAVDWLVQMRRLPANRMLDAAIRAGTAEPWQLDTLTRRLVAFYRTAAPIEFAPGDYCKRLEAGIVANRRELEDAAGALPPDAVCRVHEALLVMLRDTRALFDRRSAERRIVEAHGDLRPEHVLLGTEPQVIDCLEFNREFRILDPIDELSFLAMECAALGGAEVGTQILSGYCELSGDRPPQRLLDFHACCRACLRAKLAIAHLEEVPAREPARWPALARQYLELAEGYAARL